MLAEPRRHRRHLLSPAGQCSDSTTVGNTPALNVFEVGPEEIIGERRRQGGRGAIDHFAIGVDSLATLEEVRRRLVDAGAEIGEIQRLGGEWSLFFRDVDGMELEVCANADAAPTPSRTAG